MSPKSLPRLIAATLLAAGLLNAGLAAPAHAFTPGGAFTLYGTITLSKPPLNLTCTAVLQVTAPVPTSAFWPDGEIQSVTLYGGAQNLCRSIAVNGLPWRISNPTFSATSVQISPVTFLAGAYCGPATLSGTWSNTTPGTLTVASVALPGGCTIAWSLTASPAQTLP